MLLEWIPSLRDNKIIKLITSFLYSKYYVILIGIATLLCNIFAFEIYLFYAFVTLGVVLPALLCDDFLPIVAPLSMTYSSISMKSNSIKYNTSLFGGNRLVHLYILVAIILVFLIAKITFDLIKKPERRVKPALLLGYILLGPCYVLGGLLSPYYEQRTVVFGLVNFLAISGCYFILLYAINWKNVKKDYFFWVMLTYGLAISCEVFYMYIVTKTGSDAFISYLGHMYTGWGMRNNIAAQICLCIAAPVYLAFKNKKYDWLFLSVGYVMILGCLLTNSRGGTITSILFYAITLIVYFIRSDKKGKIHAGIVTGVVLTAAIVYFVFRRDSLIAHLSHIFNADLESYDTDGVSGGRITTWIHGFEHFGENEMFGVGFYQCTDYKFVNFSTNFVPPRYHNIYVQYLASTGLVGLCAYVFHRYQTLKMTFKKPTLEKTFIYFTVIILVFTSWFDNHFFNMGPGLNYCVALAFIEGLNIQQKRNN